MVCRLRLVLARSGVQLPWRGGGERVDRGAERSRRRSRRLSPSPTPRVCADLTRRAQSLFRRGKRGSRVCSGARAAHAFSRRARGRDSRSESDPRYAVSSASSSSPRPPALVTSVGLRPFSIVSLVITHLETSLREG